MASNGTGCRGQVGVDDDHGDARCRAVGGATGVETEPSEPEDEDAERRQGNVVPQDGFDLRAVSCRTCPVRGPSTMAPARAAQPPTEWTTVEPAKSMNQAFQPAAAVEQAAPGPAAEDRVDDGRETKML